MPTQTKKNTPKYDVRDYGTVRVSIRPDKVRFFLKPEGREFLREQRELMAAGGAFRNDLDLFRELTESMLVGNSWSEIHPEQIGDLRDDCWMVISEDWAYQYPDGEAPSGLEDSLLVGVAYSYPLYAIESYIVPLVRNGYLDFPRHDYLTAYQFEAELRKTRHDLYDAAE